MIVQDETALEWIQRINCDFAYLPARHLNFNKHQFIKIGQITEIVGDDATGKTQLAMTIIAELLSCKLQNMNTEIYIIDFNTFRVERLAEIFSHRSPDVPIDELLNRIKCSFAVDSVQFEERLSELENILEHSSFIPLIFINKIGAILFDAVSDENKQGHIQKRILKILKEFCQKFGTTIITTNHLVDWRGYPTPSLGKVWINGIQRRVCLEKDENETTNLYAKITGDDGNICSEKIRYKLTRRGFDML